MLETVAAFAGAVIVTVGGVVSEVVLLTLKETAALVALLPAVSVNEAWTRKILPSSPSPN